MDRQSQAYREATDEDHWKGQISTDDTVHEPLEDVEQLLTPDDYEDDDWDQDREGPKSIEEAQAALADRIEDPEAPDDESVRGAYDN